MSTLRETARALAHPVHKPGNNYIVSVRCSFEDESGEKIMTSGLATASSERENTLREAEQLAAEHARLVAEQIQAERPKVSTAITVLMEAIASTAEEVAIPAFEASQEGRGITKEQLAQLDAPTDDAKQRELDLLCETLGLPKVDTEAKGWPMKATIAAIHVLTRMAKRLETRD